jgi:hypothetical protein
MGGRQPNREMEEIWLRKTLLRRMHLVQGYQFLRGLCVQGAQNEEAGGVGGAVLALWLQGLCQWRLILSGEREMDGD